MNDEPAGAAPVQSESGAAPVAGSTPVPPAAPVEMTTIPVHELQALQAQLSAAQTKADEYLSLARYAKADFVNYQDRVRKDKADWNRLALQQFASDLLSAIDGFSMANFEDPKLNEAIRILEKEFVRVLSKYGITPIDTVNKAFDPMLHDAIAIEQGGTMLQEARRGWMIDGKVLRAAPVRIVRAPAPPPPAPQT